MTFYTWLLKCLQHEAAKEADHSKALTSFLKEIDKWTKKN